MISFPAQGQQTRGSQLREREVEARLGYTTEGFLCLSASPRPTLLTWQLLFYQWQDLKISFRISPKLSSLESLC